MPNAAREGDDHTCPSKEPGPVDHVGGPIQTGSPDVDVEFMPAARAGIDFALCEAGGPDFIAQGSGTVLINNKLAARAGDMTTHAGVIVGFAGTVEIGVQGDAKTVLPIKKRGCTSHGNESSGSGDAGQDGSKSSENGTDAVESNGDDTEQNEPGTVANSGRKGVLSNPVLGDGQQSYMRAPTTLLLRCDSSDLDDPRAPSPTPDKIKLRIWAASTFKAADTHDRGRENLGSKRVNWQSWLEPITGNDGFANRYCLLRVPVDAKAGVYTVYLTVQDEQGDMHAEAVEIRVTASSIYDSPPIARIKEPIERSDRYWGPSGYMEGDTVTLRSMSHVPGHEDQPNAYIDEIEWELRLMSQPVPKGTSVFTAHTTVAPPPNADGSYLTIRPGKGPEVSWTITESGSWLVVLRVRNRAGESSTGVIIQTDDPVIELVDIIADTLKAAVIAMAVAATFKAILAYKGVVVTYKTAVVTAGSLEVVFAAFKEVLVGQQMMDEEQAEIAITALEFMTATGAGLVDGLQHAAVKNREIIAKMYDGIYNYEYKQLILQGHKHTDAVKHAGDRALEAASKWYVDISKKVKYAIRYSVAEEIVSTAIDRGTDTRD